MPYIRVRKQRRAFREARARHRILIAIAVTTVLFALVQGPSAMAELFHSREYPVRYNLQQPGVGNNAVPGISRKTAVGTGTDDNQTVPDADTPSTPGIGENAITPEPGTFALLGAGMVVFGIASRRRLRRIATVSWSVSSR